METLQHTTYTSPIRQAANPPLNLTRSDKVFMPHAHPDDELLSGSLARRLIESGIEVITATATDGMQSTKGDPEFVTAGKRRLEVQRSLGFIGIKADNQHFQELPDGRLSEPGVSENLVLDYEHIVALHGITAIITLGSHGLGHSDHRAVHHASMRVAGELTRAGQTLHAWEIDEHNQGSEIILVDQWYKEHIAVLNYSQFFSAPGQYDDALEQYGDLLSRRETYNAVALPVNGYAPEYAILHR